MNTVFAVVATIVGGWTCAVGASDASTNYFDRLEHPETARMRINQFQTVGVHNAYHTRQPGLPRNAETIPEWGIDQPPLHTLVGGDPAVVSPEVRMVELDLHYRQDANGNLGWGVYHQNMFDIGSTCGTVTECMQSALGVRAEHGRTTPLLYLWIEIKSTPLARHVSVAENIDTLDQLETKAFSELAGEIRAAINHHDAIPITPGLVRRLQTQSEREFEGVGSGSPLFWPTLGEIHGDPTPGQTDPGEMNSSFGNAVMVVLDSLGGVPSGVVEALDASAVGETSSQDPEFLFWVASDPADLANGVERRPWWIAGEHCVVKMNALVHSPSEITAQVDSNRLVRLVVDAYPGFQVRGDCELGSPSACLMQRTLVGFDLNRDRTLTWEEFGNTVEMSNHPDANRRMLGIMKMMLDSTWGMNGRYPNSRSLFPIHFDQDAISESDIAILKMRTINEFVARNAPRGSRALVMPVDSYPTLEHTREVQAWVRSTGAHILSTDWADARTTAGSVLPSSTDGPDALFPTLQNDIPTVGHGKLNGLFCNPVTNSEEACRAFELVSRSKRPYSGLARIVTGELPLPPQTTIADEPPSNSTQEGISTLPIVEATISIFMVVCVCSTVGVSLCIHNTHKKNKRAREQQLVGAELTEGSLDDESCSDMANALDIASRPDLACHTTANAETAALALYESLPIATLANVPVVEVEV